MEMTDFKTIIGIWLLAQAFILPYYILLIINDDEKVVLAVDFGALALLIIMYFGLKLIGV